MTDKHARRSGANAKSMNDFLTRKEALALLKNVGLIDHKGEPCHVAYIVELHKFYLSRYHTPWHRRLWARITRRGE